MLTECPYSIVTVKLVTNAKSSEDLGRNLVSPIMSPKLLLSKDCDRYLETW